MLSLGVEIQKDTKKSLRRKLETDFGDILHLVSDASGKLLAFPDSLNAHALVCENQQLKKELNALKEDTENVQHTLTKSSFASIKQLEKSKTCPLYLQL